jgi:hypothetical protein
MVIVNSMTWPVELVDSEFPRMTFAEAMDGNETMAMSAANRTTEHIGRKIIVTPLSIPLQNSKDVSRPPGRRRSWTHNHDAKQTVIGGQKCVISSARERLG